MPELGVRRLSNAIGAEITGVDLSQPIDGPTIESIRQAWFDHCVLLFREQDISVEDHITFSRHFGDLDKHDANPSYRMAEHPEILYVTNRFRDGKASETRNTGRNWHSDLSYTHHPARGSLLWCEERPEVGGDTMFTNMYIAYETLSDKLKGFLDDLYAVHDVSMIKGIASRDPEKVAELKHLNPPIAHPVVRVHPETGRKALYVSERVRKFVGMTEEESRPFLKFLCEHATQPELIYRHQWRVHDLVMWDNRCTMHVALADFDQTKTRHMQRTSLLGESSGYVYSANEGQQQAV
jgi:taurine dioxygenase